MKCRRAIAYPLVSSIDVGTTLLCCRTTRRRFDGFDTDDGDDVWRGDEYVTGISNVGFVTAERCFCAGCCSVEREDCCCCCSGSVVVVAVDVAFEFNVVDELVASILDVLVDEAMLSVVSTSIQKHRKLSEKNNLNQQILRFFGM